MNNNWNPTYNFVIKIKRDYENTFKNIDVYNLEHWIEKLNRNEYNNFAQSVGFTHYNDMVLIKYSMINVDRDMWANSNSIYRECRSVVIDLKNEELILVPFRKFFNLDEVEETALIKVVEKIKNAKIVEISNKLDGSMQSARFYRDQFIMSGSSALDPENSFRLTEGLSWLTDSHKKMLIDFPEVTFIFEYISMRDAHVVKYELKEEGLHLIGARRVDNGNMYTYKEIQEIADRYGVLVVKLEEQSLEEVLEKAAQYKSSDKEGWVIRVDDMLIKLKCDDYVNVHRILSKVSSINLVIQNIANGTYDDLISKVPELYRDRVKVAADAIYDYVKRTEDQICGYYRKAPKKELKGFMIWVDNQVPKHLKGYVRSKYLNKEYNLLKGNNDKSPHYKKASELGLNVSYSAIFGDE